MMQTCNYKQRVGRADNEPSDSKRKMYQSLNDIHKAKLDHMHHRSDSKNHDQECHQHNNKRSHNQVKRVRHHLAQLLLNVRSDQRSENRGQHASLASYDRNCAKCHHRFYTAVRCCDRIRIRKNRGYEHQSENDSDYRGSAEHLKCGPADNRRKERERRLCQYVYKRYNVIRNHRCGSAEQTEYIVIEHTAF